MKIRPVGAELFHADRRRLTDGQTDITKLIVVFAVLWNAPKNNNVGSIIQEQNPYSKIEKINDLICASLSISL